MNRFFVLSFILCLCISSFAQTDNVSRKRTTTVQKNNPAQNKPKKNVAQKQQKNSPSSNHPKANANNNLQKKSTYSVNGVSFEMIEVRGGTFEMGSEQEKPIHKVTLSTYYIGKYEVTQELWKAVMGNNPSYFNAENLPVETVSWNECKKFIEKLNSLTGKSFRFPTEAEWEFAARGGNKSKNFQYSGSGIVSDVAWYSDNSGYKTHPVGTKQPNELGIYDMCGNVWEWCYDIWGDYSSSAQTNPQGPKYHDNSHVIRGGSYKGDFKICRLSYRTHLYKDSPENYLGLRLALSE